MTTIVLDQYHGTNKPCKCRYCVGIRKGDVLIRKAKTTDREYRVTKYFINGRTPVGEDSELYEVKPFGGRHAIEWCDIVKIERK